MGRTRSSIRRPKIACTPPSPSWPSPWPISPSNMRRSVAFQAAMPPLLGACFGGANFSLPIRAKLGLFLAPILQGFLCAFLCVLSGNPFAPHRRPPSSAVSALVLSLTAPLLCADLRCLRARFSVFFCLSASSSVSPRLRVKITPTVSQPIPPRARPWHVLCLELLFPFGPLFARSGRATLP